MYATILNNHNYFFLLRIMHVMVKNCNLTIKMINKSLILSVEFLSRYDQALDFSVFIAMIICSFLLNTHINFDNE